MTFHFKLILTFVFCLTMVACSEKDEDAPAEILRPVKRVSEKLHLHGRFAIPYHDAHKEIMELMEMKRTSLEQIKNRPE